ncbi:MAG TPA: RcnB family protein, partial [Rhizomicrobium sp.]
PGNRSAGAAATGRTQTNPNAARPQGATPGNRSAGGAVTGATRANTNAVNSRGARTQNRSPAGVTTNSRGNSMSGNNAGRQPSINSLRRNVQAPRRFHNGSYRAPQGYQARRWSHGNRLPRNYFVRDYWITNFMMFGLFAPPPNLVWVRVGNDALLVDRYSGDIVQVDYGVFY